MQRREAHNKHAEELRENLRDSFGEISRVSQAGFKARDRRAYRSLMTDVDF